MRVFIGSSQIAMPLGDCVLTIGNFDGIHLGHRRLVQKTVERARSLGLPSVLVTFSPHPIQVLRPELNLKRMFSREDMQMQLRQLGIDALIVLPFSKSFAQLEPDQFMAEVFQFLTPKLIVVGYDFNFGRDRSGDSETLTWIGRAPGKHNFDVEVVPAELFNSEVISSSRIRKSLTQGMVSEANLMLARRYYIAGEVVSGLERGRKIGFPTANLKLTTEFCPARGVYAGFSEHSVQFHPALINIGVNPTFGGERSEIAEVHILDFDRKIYGQFLKFHFVERIRNEIKFDSVEHLVNQIKEDVQTCRKIVAPLNGKSFSIANPIASISKN